MQIINLEKTPSAISTFLYELRNKECQSHPALFRHNIELIGEAMAYEVSKTLHYEKEDVLTPLGQKRMPMPKEKVVLATVLRAGLPFHAGFLRMFPGAENAFVSAYRQYTDESHTEVAIHIEYMTTASVEGKTLIIVDPMLATGGSLQGAYEALLTKGTPKRTILCSVIAAPEGVKNVADHFPLDTTTLYAAAIDERLNKNKYIIPGFGDAGDLSFGEKV